MKAFHLRTILLTLTLLIACNTTIVAQHQQITLEDIWATGRFTAKRVQHMISLADGIHYAILANDSVHKYRYTTGERVATLFHNGMLIPAGKETPLKMDYFQLNHDETKVLIATETERIYRRSTRSYFYLLNLITGQLTAISDKGKQRLADFSPDGSRVAFVQDNNLFIKDLLTLTETQVTFDGKDRHIINGTTDWVYEEEFQITKGFEWSPDSRRIAFMRFDESGVKEFWIREYGELYPTHHKYKYPKAGEANSIVTVHIFDLESGVTVKVDTGKDTEYIPRLKWTANPLQLSVQRMNRHQNHLEILLADATSGTTTVLYEENNRYFVAVTDDLHFLSNGRHFILTSEKDGFRHIYLYDMKGVQVRQLTNGQWDVTEMYGIDKNNETVFFQAAKLNPLNREVYAVRIRDARITTIASTPGTNSAHFSSTFDFFMHIWHDAHTPPVFSVSNRQGKVLRVLQDNAELRTTANEFGFTRTEFFQFDAAEGVQLNGWMMKPIDFDPSKQYPVLMYVYGGPDFQTVLNAWGGLNMVWFQMLTQMGYIVVSVDNRGTGARGEEFRKMTYLELGKYETIDQVATARYLAGMPFVDSTRIGIFGWSYGGYVALLCLTKGDGAFSAGIAVAPVTSWRFYDNIYTERFMRTPAENPDGYDLNSPLTHAAQLQGRLLLVHGTGDDNVHVENTMKMVDALINANIQFDLMLYPNRDHGIRGTNVRLHLYHLMTQFIDENL